MFRYDDNMGDYYIVSDEEWSKPQLMEVDATGTGCLLIRTEVFLNMDYPWFEFTKTEAGKVVGEDVGFCKKAKKAGYKIYVDTSINCGHMGLLEVNAGTYFVNKKLSLVNEELNKDNLEV
jgi:hypothetical protein